VNEQPSTSEPFYAREDVTVTFKVVNSAKLPATFVARGTLTTRWGPTTDLTEPILPGSPEPQTDVLPVEKIKLKGGVGKQFPPVTLPKAGVPGVTECVVSLFAAEGKQKPDWLLETPVARATIRFFTST
jgi:hypothetical protein